LSVFDPATLVISIILDEDVILVCGKLAVGLELAGKAILTFPAFLLTNH